MESTDCPKLSSDLDTYAMKRGYTHTYTYTDKFINFFNSKINEYGGSKLTKAFWQNTYVNKPNYDDSLN